MPTDLGLGEKRHRATSLPLTLSAILIFAALDSFSWTSDGPAIRYLVCTVVITVAFAFDASAIGSGRVLNRVVGTAAVLYVGWLVYIAVNAATSRQWAPDTFVLIAAPLPLAAAPFVFLGVRRRPKRLLSPTVRGLPYASALIFAVAGLSNALASQVGVPPTFLSHEKFFLAIVVIALPEASRPWMSNIIKFLTILAVAVSFAKYPSATVLVAIAAAILFFFLLRLKSGVRAVSLLIGLTAAALATLPYVEDSLAAFYADVGRTNNSSTRQHLWEQARVIIQANPLTGGSGATSITGIANINGIYQPVPFHNSFLTLAVFGGLIADVLFVLLIVTVVAKALLTSPELRRRNSLWAPPLVAGLVTFAVNPVLDQLGTALPFYALFLFAMVAPDGGDRTRSESGDSKGQRPILLRNSS